MALIPMGSLIPGTGGLGLGIPGIPAQISVDWFFDRSTVQNALKGAKKWGLYRAGSVVMQISRRSIRKMGLAKPQLRIMRENPGIRLRDILRDPGVPERTKRRVRERIFEIRFRPWSAAGTPPHTHTGIFRRGITYAFDPSTESVVVGQTLQGGNWLAALHEYGGYQRMQAWAWVPRWPRYNSGILSWHREGRAPRNPARWVVTGFRKTFRYPERPYMQPAMLRAIASGRIPRQFRNRFRMGGL